MLIKTEKRNIIGTLTLPGLEMDTLHALLNVLMTTMAIVGLFYLSSNKQNDY